MVLTLEWSSNPFAARESVDSAVTAVATPRRSEYHPCDAMPAFLKVGITTRLPRLCRSSGLPEGPRKIGPEDGFLSDARTSVRIPVSGSMIGAGFADPLVLGVVVWVC